MRHVDCEFSKKTKHESDATHQKDRTQPLGAKGDQNDWDDNDRGGSN